MFTPRLFKIKKHSRRVLIFKRSLPVFAFILASLMLVWPILFAEQKEQFSVAVKTDRKNTSAKVDMEQVRFYAQDKKKQPLTVTAPKVLETDSDNQIITLYKPVATYEMENGIKLTRVNLLKILLSLFHSSLAQKKLTIYLNISTIIKNKLLLF